MINIADDEKPDPACKEECPDKVEASTAIEEAKAEPQQEPVSEAVQRGIQLIEERKKPWYSYLATKEFWALMAVEQTLSLCITGTNTFTTFLANASANIPAFQSLFHYVVVMVVYTLVFVWRKGWRQYAAVAYADWWRYGVLAFLDVQGNYFTVLAFRYTNMLSVQLIGLWTVVCIVIISATLLRVRYCLAQVVGVLICCGGIGLLLASDHMTGANSSNAAPDRLRGDLFAILGASCYSISNVFEEYMLSLRPTDEVLSFLGVFGTVISGAQVAIFERPLIYAAVWAANPYAIAGWLVGYTACLTVFYSLAPIMLCMGSAAVFNLSLLTANIWGLIIGIRVFGYIIYYFYPIALALVICGLFVYSVAGGPLCNSKKVWQGDNQDGITRPKALNTGRACPKGDNEES